MSLDGVVMPDAAPAKTSKTKTMLADRSFKATNIKNIAAVVITSDGCYNTGTNPEFITYDFPVYTVYDELICPEENVAMVRDFMFTSGSCDVSDKYSLFTKIKNL